MDAVIVFILLVATLLLLVTVLRDTPCPKCGSENVQSTRVEAPPEAPSWTGWYCLYRCRDCRHTWSG